MGGIKSNDAAGDTPQKNIVWLASYPKSGNTWTRILFANLTNGDDGWKSRKGAINLAGSISSNRSKFDAMTGLPSSDLTDDEIDVLRPEMYSFISSQVSDKQFVKVHDAYHKNMHGKPLFPKQISIGAIYIVRDPMDVAISLAYHRGAEDFKNSVKKMSDPKEELAGNRALQLRQIMLDWSGHYNSWNDQSDIPVLCIRYEDMLADTFSCLKKMAEFAGLPEAEDDDQIRFAVEQSDFKKLQKNEVENGFREKPDKAERFFRSGKSGEGQEKLAQEQQDKICRDHKSVMQKLGYL